VELSAEDWRKEIIDYLKNPSKKVYKQLRYKAIKYVLLEMSYIIVPSMEFCSDVSVKRKLKILMGEIHEGVCGAHQSAFKMKWMIRNNNCYWPTILEDCFKYYK
jgi:hypothetical protein